MALSFIRTFVSKIAKGILAASMTTTAFPVGAMEIMVWQDPASSAQSRTEVSIHSFENNFEDDFKESYEKVRTFLEGVDYRLKNDFTSEEAEGFTILKAKKDKDVVFKDISVSKKTLRTVYSKGEEYLGKWNDCRKRYYTLLGDYEAKLPKLTQVKEEFLATITEEDRKDGLKSK